MKQFFESKRIAVIGASRDRAKVGNAIFRNLLAGEKAGIKTFPVNPNADYIEGNKAFSSVLDIPYIVDMAIIAIPAEKVPLVLEECGKKEIKNVIVISAGFSESGNLELNEKIKEIIGKFKINLLGPNVLGIINPYKSLNASFFAGMPEKGNIAFISQSGAVGSAILDKALKQKLGISGFVSLGNMLQQDFNNFLDYFANDIRTEVIVLYIETLKQNTGKGFVEICRKISCKKKIIALKAGKTDEGMAAAKTHTSGLSSPAKIYSGAFKQAGIIEAESLNELFKLSEVFSKYKKIGNKTCIITNAGGLGVLAADSCSEAGFEITEIPEQVLLQLDKFLPSMYSRRNPLDILGDANPDRYDKVLRILNMHKVADFFIVIVSPQEMTQPMQTAEVLSKYKNVFSFFVGGKSFDDAKKLLQNSSAINFDDVSDIKILGRAISRDRSELE